MVDADHCIRALPPNILAEIPHNLGSAAIYGGKYRTELASSVSHHWRRTPHLEAAWHNTPGGTARSRPPARP